MGKRASPWLFPVLMRIFEKWHSHILLGETYVNTILKYNFEICIKKLKTWMVSNTLFSFTSMYLKAVIGNMWKYIFISILCVALFIMRNLKSNFNFL